MTAKDDSVFASRLLARELTQEGLKGLWFRGLSFTRIYRRLIVLERPLAEPTAEVPIALSMSVGVLDERQVPAYAVLRPDQDLAAVRRRFAKGHPCFVVWHEDQIIHAAWVATGRTTIEYLSRELVLAPDEVYVYDAFTAPRFRGCGASPFRALAMGDHLRARGYRRVLTAVHPENRRGFRPLEKVGTRRVGVIGYFGIGPWRWQFSRRTGRLT